MSFRRDAAEERARGAFESEMLVHLTEIYRAAMRLTRRAAEAEDLSQEVFLQAWKSFERFSPGTNGRAWLYKILWNVNQQRLRKRFPVLLGEEEQERLADTLPAVETTPTEVRDEEVAAALLALTPEHRTMLQMADVEEWSYKEIAEILGVPIGTVMSRLSRARGSLRAKLAGSSHAPRASSRDETIEGKGR